LKRGGLNLFENVPKIALIGGIPVVAFIITISFTLARNGGEEGAGALPTLEVAVQKSQVTPTPQAVATPTPGRTCAQIQGTSYQSDAERDYYLKSCSGASQAAAGGGVDRRGHGRRGPEHGVWRRDSDRRPAGHFENRGQRID
jgi:hypothetical protein